LSTKKHQPDVSRFGISPTPSFKRERPMKIIGYLALVLISTCVCFADEIATTESGRQVLLRDSGLWEDLSDTDMERGRLTDDARADRAKALSDSDAPTQASADEAAAGYSRNLLYAVIGIAAILLLVIALLLKYFLILVPRKKLKFLRQAYDIIESQVEDRFAEAEDLLTTAISKGLKEKDMADVHFAMAYIKARSKKFQEALVHLAKCSHDDRAAINMSLWLHLQLEQFQDAYQTYRSNSDLIYTDESLKKMASLACLKLGQEKWQDRDVKSALLYFDEVRNLEVLSDRLPSTISDYQITFGVLAMFDDQMQEAREHFEKALEQSEKENESGITAQIGLLLCDWKSPGAKFLAIDEALAEILAQMDQEKHAQTLQVAAAAPGLEADQAAACDKKPPALTEDGIFYRNVNLMFAISLIKTWLIREKTSGLPDEAIETLDKRLAAVSAIDKSMGDPVFIRGLIDYYFRHSQQRKEAVQMLEDSQVKVPEVELLIKREKALIEAESQSLERYFALAKKYLQDRTIPIELRDELLRQLSQFERFKRLAKEAMLQVTEEELSGSIKDMQSRSELLQKRIQEIIRPKIAEDDTLQDQFDDLIKDINQTTKNIASQATALEESQQKLMLETGQYIFVEEEQTEPST
jgi:hypothetical protein